MRLRRNVRELRLYDAGECAFTVAVCQMTYGIRQRRLSEQRD